MTTPAHSNFFTHLAPVALAGLLILTSFGCQSTPADPTVPPRRVDAAKPLPDAESLIAAAQASSGKSAATLYLDAARELLARGETGRAEAALAAVDASLLDSPARFLYELTRAAIATDSKRPEDAYRILRALEPGNAAQRREYDLALADAASATGRYADAAEALMTLTGDDAQTLNDRIWAYIVRTPPMEVDVRAATAEDATRRGWWRLAVAVDRAFDVAEQRSVLAKWQNEFTSHPAARVPPTALRRLASPTSNAQRIALLLPMSGQLATAGRAVRDGFVSAFYRAGADRTITVYDTTTQDMNALYEQAVLDGGNVIVGPLDKPNVSALNAIPVRMVPALVLNHLADGETATPGLYQFALAIEDEGRAIADRVAEDRRNRIVLLRADQDWANRATEAFFAHRPEAKDSITAEGVIYDIKSLTDSIARVLLVDQSTERANQLAALLGERAEFVPRRRRDVDAVIALVDTLQARALLPALAYYFAGDVPVYTSSQAVQGLDENALSELNGARVCQIPWRIGTDPLRSEIEGSFADASGGLSSLFAFGVDAYRIVDRLDVLASEPHTRILGATGVLTPGEAARIHREPAWSIVRRGHLEALPVLVDNSPQ